LIALVFVGVPSWATPLRSTGTTDVYFSPQGGATEAIVREIDSAKRDIKVLAYSFTSVPIAKSLLNAHKRGVHVEAVLDKSNRKVKPGGRGKSYSAATFLVNAGIPTYIDDKHPIQHNKVICIDGETLITGSFNFSRAAEEKNAENLLVIKGNKPLVDKYLENYREHQAHSERY
jgi:phosphatidylserine/phosphatidylglycerophosphate/cardiolipin synthase-like enzyme